MHLFPESGFDQSATTPVFLGVLVTWFFTETLGWVFVGLVVPGYLATLFVLDPRAASIDVGEALLTYVVARLLAEHLSRTRITSRMFGRERFLMVVAVSVLVRLVTEGVVLQRLFPHARWAYSIGLVVVPLAANACWKTGSLRGVVQNGVPTLIVYAALRWVLVPYTNLSLASFHLSIEDVAARFLGSPHAYVLLLTGAALGAFANVRYGWDYGGILIPALLALVVETPMKLGATFLEVVALLVIVQALLGTTPLRRHSIEGPRRVVLFFTVDYALRFALAAFASRHFPSAAITDLSGLGYLLPTLIAVKASQKGIAALVVLPTLVVSFLAFGVATALGAVGSRIDGGRQAPEERVTRRLARSPDDTISAALWISALSLPGASKDDSFAESDEVARYVERWWSGKNPPPVSLDVQALPSGVRVVRERFESLDSRRGTPAILMTPSGPDAERVVAVVDSPLSAPQAAALAGHWLEVGVVDAVVISGFDGEPSNTSGRLTEARWLGRRLAKHGTRQGIVVDIRGGDAPSPEVAPDARARSNRRAASLLDELSRQGARTAPTGVKASGLASIIVKVPPSGADVWISSPSGAASASTIAALTSAFDGAAASNERPAVEDVLVMRRLVLDPLLGSNDAVSEAVVRRMSWALGYTLSRSTAFPHGRHGFLLAPRDARGTLALAACAGGARRLVIEAPHGDFRGIRRLALELLPLLEADAVLVGLSLGQGGLGNDVFAEAHAAAVWPLAGRDAQVLSVRRDSAAGDQIAAFVGEWGGASAESLAMTVKRVLGDLGVTPVARPLDVSTREQAGRSIFGQTPLVELSVTSELLRTSRFSVDSRAIALLSRLPTRDGECGATADELARSLGSSADAPDDLFDSARAAAWERSVVAARRLEGWSKGSAAIAAVVRSDAGTFLLAVGRRAGVVCARAFEIPPSAERVATSARQASTLGECETALVSGALCCAGASR